MNTQSPNCQARRRSGISLLEVLISIGILSIGLISVLALIPAGRTYLNKAAIDDRAAALIPNAYTTMRNLGLFRKDSLSWIDAPQKMQPNDEAGLVIREVAGVGDVFSNPDGINGKTFAGCWEIRTIDSETISSWYGQDLPIQPPRALAITGSTPPVPPPADPTDPHVGREINLAITPTDSGSATLFTGTSLVTGSWTFPIITIAGTATIPGKIPISLFTAPRMEIFTSGPDVGKVSNTPWKDYAVTATYTGTAGPVTANPDPASIRQYGPRRSVDHRIGRAKITYVAPSNSADNNHSAPQAATVAIDSLENATVQGRGTIARSVSTKVLGTLWRMELGSRHGIYNQDVDFNNVPNAGPRPRPAIFPDDDITVSAGFSWLDGDGNEVPPSPTGSPPIPETPEDIDWYRFDVDAGNMLKITWTDPDSVLLADGGQKFPLYLNTTSPSSANRLVPFESDGNGASYSIPNDGYVVTRAQLENRGDLQNTFGGAGEKRIDRRNPAYDFTIEVRRSERVIVVDPLMATRLDKVISLNGGSSGRFDPYYLRRHRFANFQQTFAGSGTPRAFIIPRLNWQALSAGDIDTMLAMADRLFRDQDAVANDLPVNDDDAPTPLFDLNGDPSAPKPLRRQTEGRMSWLLMIQPEDPGPVASNWEAGKYFDVSMVVFQDRKLPPLAARPALEGEYALSGLWSDLDGMLTVSILPTGATEGIDEDDVRDLFRTGAWLLLAPQTNYDADPLTSTQRLDWVRIQTSSVQKQPSGGFVVSVLLETEPADTILNVGKRTTANVSPLVVMAYQGVVAVVNKSMQLQP